MKLKKIALILLIIAGVVGIVFTTTNPSLAKNKKKTSSSKSCKDTDHGLNYYKKGKGLGIYVGASTGWVIGKNGMPVLSGTKRSTIFDQCVNTKQLNEVYCSGGRLSTVAYQCPKGCRSGACIK